MKIYDFAASPNARKVRAVAYELGLSPTFCPVNIFKGESRTAEFMTKNPNGRIPVLEEDGFVLWESNAIVCYLAATHPEKNLLPTEPRARALVDQWLSWQVAQLQPAVGKVAWEKIVKGLRGLGGPDQAVIDAATQEFAACSAAVEAWLASGREYVAGQLSVADLALACYFGLADQLGLPVSAYPHVKAWNDKMQARESLKRMMADVMATVPPR
jgi:glutathione S-transferase